MTLTDDAYNGWTKELRGLASKDRDALIIITGLERSGKTTLARRIARRINPGFNTDHMHFSTESLMEAAARAKKGTVLVLDEAVKGGFSRDAMTQQNRNFAKFLAVAGERNLIIIVIFPNIRWLDPYISEHRAAYWLLVKRRGWALLHRALRADYKGAKSHWQQLFYIRYGVESGEDWDRYVQKKSAEVRDMAQRSDATRFVPEPREVQGLSAKLLVVAQEGA